MFIPLCCLLGTGKHSLMMQLEGAALETTFNLSKAPLYRCDNALHGMPATPALNSQIFTFARQLFFASDNRLWCIVIILLRMFCLKYHAFDLHFPSVVCHAIWLLHAQIYITWWNAYYSLTRLLAYFKCAPGPHTHTSEKVNPWRGKTSMIKSGAFFAENVALSANRPNCSCVKKAWLVTWAITCPLNVAFNAVCGVASAWCRYGTIRSLLARPCTREFVHEQSHVCVVTMIAGVVDCDVVR